MGFPYRTVHNEGELQRARLQSFNFARIAALCGRSPPERRDLLRVSQKNCSIDVRNRVWEAWKEKLLGLPSRLSEAAAAMLRYNAVELEARRIVAGVTPERPKVPQTLKASLVTKAENNTESAAGLPPEQPSVPQRTETPLVTKAEEPKGDSNAQRSEASMPANEAAEGKWEEVEISFISDERVQIRRGKKTETLNYAEFGFEDARTGNPNLAWEALRRLAELGGVIENEKDARLRWLKLERRIQEIRSVLRKHFALASDPIPFFEKASRLEKSGYHARFKISCAPSYRS